MEDTYRMKGPMRNFRVIFNILLTCWLLAIGIDGFWGGVTASQVGASISLVGAVISFLPSNRPFLPKTARG